MRKLGFDSKKYEKLTTKEILKRSKSFNNKLYLEIGGKLFDDYHASRVLPGFKYDAKIEILKKLKNKLEVIICISAKDIERNKIRADFNITYEKDLMRLIDKIRKNGLSINSVVITLFDNQQSVLKLRNKLELNNIKVYLHTFTKGYPTDIDKIVSEEGYGANPYIETSKELVVVTAPGPSSGKLATCLSQLYHEYKRGIKAGYAKLETFPTWNLPLKHPVNIAYEAATADLKDVNMIDPFHMEAYNEIAVNYNRDIEVYPILRNILRKITNDDIYKSPTDMGINMTGYCIKNDDVVIKACYDEIIRRYLKALVEYKRGNAKKDTCERIKLLMNELDLNIDDRKVVRYAKKKEEQKNAYAMAIELSNGKIITGRKTDYMSPAASTVLNALKSLAKLDMDVDIISSVVLEPMLNMKKNLFDKSILDLKEILLALSINEVTNPIIDKVLEQIPKLEHCEAHITCIPSSSDDITLKKLGINYTCDPIERNNELFND